MANFKIGDFVRCVDNDAASWLVRGAIYSVTGEDHGYLELAGVKGTNFSDRFVSADMPIKRLNTPKHRFKAGDVIKCIDNRGTSLLKEGELYEIKSATSMYVEVVGIQQEWSKERFVLAENTSVDPSCHYNLKAGDFVKCVDDFAGPGLVQGKIYEIERVVGGWVYPKGVTGAAFGFRFLPATTEEIKNMAPKFKVGDYVQCVNQLSYYNVKVGNVYRVTGVMSGGKMLALDGLPNGYLYQAAAFASASTAQIEQIKKDTKGPSAHVKSTIQETVDLLAAESESLEMGDSSPMSTVEILDLACKSLQALL